MFFGLLVTLEPAAAETLADALVKTYQNNPQLNAERARQRGTDEDRKSTRLNSSHRP